MIHMGEKRANKTALPVILMFVIITGILAVSFYYIYSAVVAYLGGATQEAFYYGLLGLIGFSISAYVTYTIGKRRVSQKPLPKITTVTECKKCGFKNLNKFAKGDYIFKTVGSCPKCNEPMLVTGIYAEEVKTK